MILYMYIINYFKGYKLDNSLNSSYFKNENEYREEIKIKMNIKKI